MIGTPANVEIMREAGLLAPEGEAVGPNDLVVAVRASGEAAAEAALARAGDALERKRAPAEGGQWRPRTLDGALDRMADANLVVVSTPGACAAREARRALDRGLNVMLFSDNVPLESERTLKERAHARGLLVMGPDCGTAYVAGTPLAFANVVPRGRIGVVAASGTGLQEGRGVARPHRRRHLARDRGRRARPLRCGRRHQHPRRHRSSRIGRGHRPPDPRLQASRPADRAPRLRTAGGGGQALHRGRVRRRGKRDRTAAGRAGSRAHAQGRGRARGRTSDRPGLRSGCGGAGRGGEAGAGAPCAPRPLLRGHARDGGAGGAGGDGAPRRLECRSVPRGPARRLPIP